VQQSGECAPDGGDPFAPRLESILEAARLHRTGVPVRDLAELLPSSAPADGDAVSRWLADHPHVGEVVGERAIRPGAAPVATVLDERRSRGALYRVGAERLIRETFGPVGPLLRCVGITGSTAYLEPEPGDDLDLLVVTRSGALWVFLAYAYVALRLRRRPPPADLIAPCMNYVMDDVEARRDFGRPQGFLFAREALTTRPLEGGEYLRGLVGASPWLGREVPRLYARWQAEGLGSDPTPSPAPLAVRALNALLFVPMAAYLQLVGLVRNRRAHSRGNSEAAFRTMTLPRRLSFQSDRFGRLNQLYVRGQDSGTAEPGASA
jgi:hypothetical protein